MQEYAQYSDLAQNSSRPMCHSEKLSCRCMQKPNTTKSSIHLSFEIDFAQEKKKINCFSDGVYSNGTSLVPSHSVDTSGILFRINIY